MKQVKHIGGLPRSLQTVIKTFLDDPVVSGNADPAIFEMSETEIEDLANEEEIVLQLIADKKYGHWFLVAVGEYERQRRSELILPPSQMMIRRSIIAFTPVDDAWIRGKRAEALRHKMIKQEAMEYQEDHGIARWV